MLRDCQLQFDGAEWIVPSKHALGPPELLLRCDSLDEPTILTGPDGLIRRWTDAFDAIEWMSGAFDSAGPSIWAGYLSYDFGLTFEAIPPPTISDPRTPMFVFTRHRLINKALEARESKVAKFHASTTSSLPNSNFSRAEFESAVARVIEYIREGDIFQVNLSQRFTVETSISPRAVYDRLQLHAPAQYGALLDFGDHCLVSNSPELFLRVSPDGMILTRPIKGTRPRSPGMFEELRDSAKDQAELNMIIDLERNDLGRICRIGSIRVTEPRSIETHPTVYHGVASIEGILRDDVTFIDLLRATFPGGSVTGAPKVRALQIISELERCRRGAYCGAIGYLASDGTIEFNVAIRTMTAVAGKFDISVGGGIVADSNPASEYEETLVKAKAMFAALGVT